VHGVEPDDAGLNPSSPGPRVDPDAAHPFGPQQDGVRQRPKRCGVVAGALGSDPQAAFRRVTDGADDIRR
jgi:hypothetical protein